MYLVGVGAVSTPSMLFGGTSQLDGFEVTRRDTCVLQGYYKGCTGSVGSVYAQVWPSCRGRWELLSEHVQRRMSNVSVAVREDCVGLRAAPTRENSQVSVSWQVG